ncbi:MAG TPA: biotin/lipoyl-containing protein [Candidatus Saccharimonadales bacterium]|nr:biotin/lipoyl-containing protein [Candidatus Saccharimonadales bacterium]
MNEPTTTEALALLDELLTLAAGSVAGTIEVEAGDLAVVLVRDVRPAAAAVTVSDVARRAPAAPLPQQVHATSVGIFSATREWAAGDAVAKGASLGAIQSLGHMTEITAPVDGVLTSVLIAGGAPVEYGQPLFAMTAAS